MRVVAHMDIERFMGQWYVLGGIPTFAEKDAYNPLENYELNDDGSIATTFSYNHRNVAGPQRTLNSRAFVSKDNKAIWGMQFVWPLKADYRVVYLDPDYQQTIVGRVKRDYLWIMARDPDIPDSALQEMIDIAVSLGYERDKIQLTNWRDIQPEAAAGS